MSSQTIKITAAVILLAAAALLTLRALRGGRVEGKVPDTVWFYDLQSGELFTAAAETIPPAGTPAAADSTDGVRAHVYTCGSCDPDERQVLYLEMYSDDARAAMEQIRTLTDAQQQAPLWPKVNQGQYVAAVPAEGAQPQWVLMQSPRGKELTGAFWTLCGSKGRGTLCPPQ